MALVAETITYSYGGGSSSVPPPEPAVDGFSASFEHGRVSAIMGPNGCGKTTLAKLLVGILKPLHGEVILDGTNLVGLTLAETGKRVGLVMQQPGRQLFCTSVKDEIEFGLKCLELSQEETEQRKNKYLEYFGLQQYEDRFPFELSTGEKQRLVIAAVVCMQPDYLILDEPTSALDRGRKRALGALLRRLSKDENTGVILISHDEWFVSEYADGVTVMDHGRIVCRKESMR
ncbi:MAG: energy-coupling factor ABC transporter ATP-binding protein [Clostridiales Family XIII bacterium]|jgi:energy-coupling factor transport system ATP-binding protein|nr:energy-coupling factor ABC transporter ATP-binding protein [Clostridiales Family XIII bacterium]